MGIRISQLNEGYEDGDQSEGYVNEDQSISTE